MKKKIVKALFVLFLLFSIGGGFAIMSLRQMNDDLRNLISLHKVEIIRQDLVINVQNVQGNLYTVGTGLGRELDEIVKNVTSLDRAVYRCNGCHHKESIKRRITDVQDLIVQYKEALSAFITTTANQGRISRLKSIAADIGERILGQTQEMTFIANESLQRKTEAAVSKVIRIQNLIIATLILTMVIGFVVAASLTRTVTSPINKLVEATKEISSGNLGYTTDFSDDTEFSNFAHTFNEMSISLKDSHNKIISYMNRLSVLVRGTVSLYSTSDVHTLMKETVDSVNGIIQAEQVGIILFDRENHRYCLMSPEQEDLNPCIGEQLLKEMYERSNRKAIIVNEVTDETLPLRELDGRLKPRNIMIVWLSHLGDFKGALRIANKIHGSFDIEDLRLLSILANNFAVALDNISLYNDLTRKMQELQETQQQLIQAAKLAAIGELASTVAHEINNPLTSILGYAELIKEETERDIIMKDVEVIEQESLRAREIVRQLLEFSRKKPLELKETDINELLRDVLRLMAINLKATAIVVREEYQDIPAVMADGDQLRQVFLNIINNAIGAMGKKGTLTIDTGMKGDEILIGITDTGEGIDEEALPRIFEPFYTTKKEKGTGLGLSISYKIISAHHGRIGIMSKKGQGSRFTIVLPVRKAALHVSP